MTAPLQIELTAPQTVDGRRVPYQSLWLLVRMAHARRHEAAAGGDGMVRPAELRRQFTDARSLRMFVSRAFRDFAAWGVRAGWGEDGNADPRFLNQDRRSQGPFWLPPDEAMRIDCRVQGAPAGEADLLAFLGLKRAAPAAPAAALPMPADYWMALAGAQQDLRQGRLLAALDDHGRAGRSMGALGGYKEAFGLAGNRLQRALAVLGEAQVWRRLDDLDAARKTLVQLRRVLREGGADEGGYLDAMEQVLTAWCAYAQRDLVLTEGLLAAMRQAEPRAAVVRHHPRIRFEWHNLMALVRRAHALEGDDRDDRRRAAHESMGHFATALDAAFEFGSFDAAQQVAANIGMAAWLFACEGLVGDRAMPAARAEALRWLLTSEWLCQCAGLSGQTAWNAIYLMRVARGDAPARAAASLAEFRSAKPLQPADILAGAAYLHGANGSPLLPASWRALAERLLARERQGEARYSLLQACGLRLEHAWYAAHEGDADAARRSLDDMHAAARQLPPSDRAFFMQAAALLPPELRRE